LVQRTVAVVANLAVNVRIDYAGSSKMITPYFVSTFVALLMGQTEMPSAIELHHLHQSPQMALTDRGDYLITWETHSGKSHGSIEVWNTESWELASRKSFTAEVGFRVREVLSNTIFASALTHGVASEYRLSIPELTAVSTPSDQTFYVESSDGLMRAFHPLLADRNPSKTRIEVRKVETNTLVTALEPYKLRATILGFSPDSRYLLYTGQNHELEKKPSAAVATELHREPPFHAWDLVENCEFRHAVRGNWRWKFRGFTGDGKSVAVATVEAILVIEFQTGRIVSRYEVNGVLRTVAMSADGRLIAFCDGEETVVWDHAMGSQVRWHCHEVSPKFLLFTPKALVTLGVRDRKILIWRLDDLVSRMKPRSD